MKAAVYHAPLDVRVQEWCDPGAPGPGEVQLEVLRASICGTDVEEYLHGPRFIPLTRAHPATNHVGPLALGHEILGRVCERGANVTELSVGDRVAPGSGVACGNCEWCRASRSNLCASYHTIGLHRDGGLAERVNVPARICRRVARLCRDDVAVLAQPLAVALHALRGASADVNTTLVITGIGGVGSLVVAAAAARGIPVIAVDVDPTRLQVAQALGAQQAVDASGEDPVAAVMRATEGHGAEVVIEASGTPSGLAASFASVRRGGHVRLVGLQRESQPIDITRLVLNEVCISTSKVHVCDVDLPDALALLETRDLSPVLDDVIGLDDVVEGGLERLARGEARGKIVV